MKKIFVAIALFPVIFLGISASDYPNYAEVSLYVGSDCHIGNYNNTYNHSFITVQNTAPYSYSFLNKTLNPGQTGCISIRNNKVVTNLDIGYYNNNSSYLSNFLKTTLVLNDYTYENFTSEITSSLLLSNFSTNPGRFTANLFNTISSKKLNLNYSETPLLYYVEFADVFSSQYTTASIPSSYYISQSQKYENNSGVNL